VASGVKTHHLDVIEVEVSRSAMIADRDVVLGLGIIDRSSVAGVDRLLGR
jgi:hypothetical protein